MTIRINHNSVIIKKIVTSTAVLAMAFSFSSATYADSFDEQIKSAQQDLAGQQANAGNLRAQANNYQEQVNQYNAQIGYLNAQIALNSAKAAKVESQIEDAKTRMADQKATLAANIKSMYLDSGVTPLEMLVSSGDISSFFNKQQYQDKVKDKVQSAMAEILKLKASLDKQQKDLAALLTSQNTQRQELAQTRSELSNLLAVASQNASAADQQVKATNSKIASLKQQQAAAIQAASRSFSGTLPGASGGSGGACDNGHGNGGYPASWCNAPQDSINTPWGYSRECVSWAGWRRQQLGRPVYGWGNANQWDDGARAAGFRVDSTPEVGAVAQTDAGFYGHVAVVEAVNGGSVTVSEMNYDNDGHFRMAIYSTSYFHYIH